MYDIPYVWNLERNDTNEPTYKTERDSQKTNLQLPGGRDSREFGMDGYTLLYSKWITNQDLLHNTGNSAQGCVPAWMGVGVWGRMDTCVCMAESLRCSPETITALLISYTPIQKKSLKLEKEMLCSFPRVGLSKSWKNFWKLFGN